MERSFESCLPDTKGIKNPHYPVNTSYLQGFFILAPQFVAEHVKVPVSKSVSKYGTSFVLTKMNLIY